MIGGLLMVIGGGILGSIGLVKLEQFRSGVDRQARRWQQSLRLSRRIIGQICGIGLAGGVVVLISALGIEGLFRWLLLLIALIGYLALSITMPRLPQLRQQRQQQAIRLALPAALVQWRIAIEAGDKLIPIMDRYASMPRPERAAIQTVILQARAAVEAGATRNVTDPQTGKTNLVRLLFADALVAEAHKTGSPELISVMNILANADQSGGIRTASPALSRAADTLDTIIKHEIDELITKRSLKLIATAAPAVVGAVLLLIFVAAAGSATFF